MKKLLLISILGMFLTSMIAQELMAIPAFARKYNMTCKTCHAPIPRLKAYGDDFAGNGFKLSDQEAPRYYVPTGDDELSLIREFPLAVRMDGFLSYNFGNDEKPDLATPYLLKLMSGGEIFENVSYYFYFYMSERGEVAGVEDAYVMFNNLFGIDFDIYLGQFQVSDPLFKRELRLTLEDYHAYTATPWFSNASLKYDRGIMATLGLSTGTDIIVEVINGNGLSHTDANHVFDNDKYKNFVGRLSQDVADFLRIGVFGYMGNESTVKTFNNVSTGIENEVMMFGPDATIGYDDILELNLQYVMRQDKPEFSTDIGIGNEVNTNAALAELVFMPNGEDSKWYGVGMFNWVDSDLDYLNYQAASLHLGYVFRRNMRMVGEVTYNMTDTDNSFAEISIGIVTAF
jgi:hypothetical protein